eukprot:CAMPEP_0196581378 /NCGR_PEP_ID=MMETSP1081-20130531/33922_1 /TAXON_ID=36882 /ORGANISM="Pyramimonas amylifera, Strain CCMP720" /LENGTH=199 /DNA_ID=CAMNT_0041901591 /DNA_START=138 /DNA_END=734 /DNA_ORIENTATION=+
MIGSKLVALCLISLLCLLEETFVVEGKYSKLLKSNVAIGIAHRWVVQRCTDQEPLFLKKHKITLKQKGNDVAYKVNDFSVKNVGRKLQGETITAGELKAKMEERFKQKLAYEDEVKRNFTAAKNWAEKHDYEEYYFAVRLVEDTCFNSTYDRGPMMLGNEMPRVLFDFMMLYHKEKGGCIYGKKEGCSTVISPPPPSPP